MAQKEKEEKTEAENSKKNFSNLKSDNEKVINKNIGLKKLLFGLIFISIVTIGFLLYLKTNIDINAQNTILWFSMSFLINIIVIIGLFATGLGQKFLAHFKRRLMFGFGNHVNLLYVSKNGPITDHFIKVDKETGSFKINGDTFVRNPKLLHHYNRIPTYVYREGSPDPLNLFHTGASDISNREIDIVMSSKGAFDIKQWLQKNAMLILIGVGAVVLVGAVSAYFGWSILELLQQGTYAGVECITPPVELSSSIGGL